MYVLQVHEQHFLALVLDVAARHAAEEPNRRRAEDHLGPLGVLLPLRGINDVVLLGQVLFVVILARKDVAAHARSQEPVLGSVSPVVGAVSHGAGPDLEQEMGMVQVPQGLMVACKLLPAHVA